MDEGFMAETRAKTMQHERDEVCVCVALQYAASFHCLVEERKDCEELRPKPMGKVGFRCKVERENDAPNRVVCGSK